MTQRGTTLVELLVALALGSVVAAMFAQSVAVQRRAERVVAHSTAAASAADEAVDVLASAIARVSDADSMLVRGDTALEWRATVGVALACFAGSDTVVVSDTGPATWWESQPGIGDAVDVANGVGAWTGREVVAMSARSNGGACGAAQRTLRLNAALPDSGALLVRVARRRRFMLYRGGDGDWWLGERTCSYAAPVSCDAAQPIAGPLLAPPSGMRFTLDSSGAHRTVSVAAKAGRVERTLTVALRP